MATPAAESTPLLPPDISLLPTTSSSSNPSPLSSAPPAPPHRPHRTVTFNANPVSKTIEPDPLPDSDSDRSTANHKAAQQRRNRSLQPQHSPAMASSSAVHPAATSASSSGRTLTMGGSGATLGGGTGPLMLSSLNNKLRRRNSQGTAGIGTAGLPTMSAAAAAAGGGSPGGPKIGPQRSTKNAQKLKLLPNTEPVADDEPPLLLTESGDGEADGPGTPARDVYSQYTRIQDPAARRDAARLGKADRERLPRVTAYCTANKYQMDGLMRFLKGRGRTRGANPKLIDECIYTPYRYGGSSSSSSSSGGGGGKGGEDRPTIQQSQSQQSTQNQSAAEAPAAGPVTPVTAHERRHSIGEVIDGDSQSAFQRGSDLMEIDLEAGMGEEARQAGLEPGESSVTLTEEDNSSSRKISDGFPPDDPTVPLLPPSLTASIGLGVMEDVGGGGGSGHSSESAIATVKDEPLAGSGSNGKARLPTGGPITPTTAVAAAELDVDVHTPEVFLFDYGVVVIWGMSAANEQRFLKELAKFEEEKLAPDDVETEFFNFYYTHEYQARIYNDFITLRDKNNYMAKLAISHALAQSVKTSLFEELIASTIDICKDIPTQIALTGKIALSRTQINMQIGELFILRINIHLNGSVLDTPELFWVEPQLEPVYQAVRSYLEMDQRVGLLTGRLDVIADLLAVLKDQLSHGHGEKLEWIVIVLIAAEILVAAINIVVDLYAGVD